MFLTYMCVYIYIFNEFYQHNHHSCFMCFISGEIESRIIILTLHFNSKLLVSHGSQIEDQGCWAQV